MNNAETKKGSIGILNRTKAPKLEVVKPIIKANKTEKRTQKSNRGFFEIIFITSFVTKQLIAFRYLSFSGRWYRLKRSSAFFLQSVLNLL